MLFGYMMSGDVVENEANTAAAAIARVSVRTNVAPDTDLQQCSPESRTTPPKFGFAITMYSNVT